MQQIDDGRVGGLGGSTIGSGNNRSASGSDPFGFRYQPPISQQNQTQGEMGKPLSSQRLPPSVLHSTVGQRHIEPESSIGQQRQTQQINKNKPLSDYLQHTPITRRNERQNFVSPRGNRTKKYNRLHN